jgi:hypothetical protein
MGKSIRALDIDLVVTEPSTGFEIAHWSADHAASCVQHDIHGPELLYSLREQRLHLRFIGKIGSQAEDFGRRVQRGDSVGGLLEPFFVAAREHDGFCAGCGPGTCYFLGGVSV